MSPTLRQVWLAYHSIRADEARRVIAHAKSPATAARARLELSEHTAAINSLDKEAQAADRKAGV
jgi:hypothetical protein